MDQKLVRLHINSAHIVHVIGEIIAEVDKARTNDVRRHERAPVKSGKIGENDLFFRR